MEIRAHPPQLQKNRPSYNSRSASRYHYETLPDYYVTESSSAEPVLPISWRRPALVFAGIVLAVGSLAAFTPEGSLPSFLPYEIVRKSLDNIIIVGQGRMGSTFWPEESTGGHGNHDQEHGIKDNNEPPFFLDESDLEEKLDEILASHQFQDPNSGLSLPPQGDRSPNAPQNLEADFHISRPQKISDGTAK